MRFTGKFAFVRCSNFVFTVTSLISSVNMLAARDNFFPARFKYFKFFREISSSEQQNRIDILLLTVTVILVRILVKNSGNYSRNMWVNAFLNYKFAVIIEKLKPTSSFSSPDKHFEKEHECNYEHR